MHRGVNTGLIASSYYSCGSIIIRTPPLIGSHDTTYVVFKSALKICPRNKNHAVFMDPLPKCAPKELPTSAHFSA